MPLPPFCEHRHLLHRRTIDISVFRRTDGLWDVDARLIDVKSRDAQMADGLRTAGTPVHDLLLRLVVNDRFDIVAAGSESTWVPYVGHCNDLGDAVRLHYPRWYRQPRANNSKHNPAADAGTDAPR